MFLWCFGSWMIESYIGNQMLIKHLFRFLRIGIDRVWKQLYPIYAKLQVFLGYVNVFDNCTGYRIVVILAHFKCRCPAVTVACFFDLYYPLIVVL